MKCKNCGLPIQFKYLVRPENRARFPMADMYRAGFRWAHVTKSGKLHARTCRMATGTFAMRGKVAEPDDM